MPVSFSIMINGNKNTIVLDKHNKTAIHRHFKNTLSLFYAFGIDQKIGDLHPYISERDFIDKLVDSHSTEICTFLYKHAKLYFPHIQIRNFSGGTYSIFDTLTSQDQLFSTDEDLKAGFLEIIRNLLETGYLHKLPMADQIHILESTNIGLIRPLFLFRSAQKTLISPKPFLDIWSSSRIGFIFIPYEAIVERFSEVSEDTIKHCDEIISEEVKAYNEMINTHSFSFIIYNANKEEFLNLNGIYEFKNIANEILPYFGEIYHSELQKRITLGEIEMRNIHFHDI